MISLLQPLSFLTVLFSGLIAGLFYSYSCSVNPGLHALPDFVYLQSMQSINTAIQNGVFFLCFLGLLILLPLNAWGFYKNGSVAAFWCVLTAALLYFVGVMGVTAFGNVPLNEKLAAFHLSSASPESIAEMRRTFETPWNYFHNIRTLCAIGSFVCMIFALLVQTKTK